MRGSPNSATTTDGRLYVLHIIDSILQWPWDLLLLHVHRNRLLRWVHRVRGSTILYGSTGFCASTHQCIGRYIHFAHFASSWTLCIEYRAEHNSRSHH